MLSARNHVIHLYKIQLPYTCMYCIVAIQLFPSLTLVSRPAPPRTCEKEGGVWAQDYFVLWFALSIIQNYGRFSPLFHF